MDDSVVLIEASQKLGDCAKPCTSREFEISTDRRIEPGLPTGKSTLMMYFQDNQTTIETEYELFGVTSIVASVGGSLGLFLGVSCLDSALYFLEIGFEKMSKWR